MFEHPELRERLQQETPTDVHALDRYDVDTSAEDIENEQTRQLIEFVWNEYGFAESLAELEDILGVGEVLDENYLLARSEDSYHHRTDPYYAIPSITTIGARTEDVSFARPIKGTNIVGVRGQMLFYRTFIQNGRYARVSTSRKRMRSERETYHEAGFFCFVVAEQDLETGSVRPSLVFGDMDKAKWPSEATKIRAAQLLNGGDYPFGYHRSDDEKYKKEEIEEFEEELFTAGKERRLRPDIKPGVFTQNREPLVNNETDKYFANQKVRKAMQDFIDRYSKPDQVKTVTNTPLRSSELNLPNQDAFQEIDMSHHVLGWEHLHQAEIAEIPLVRAVGEVMDGRANDFMALYIHPIKRAIGIMLKDTPRSQIYDDLQRSSLTDDEVRLVHSLQDIVLEARHMGQDNRIRRFVSRRWEYFLESRPDLYPGITPERLLKDPELVASLEYHYADE